MRLVPTASCAVLAAVTALALSCGGEEASAFKTSVQPYAEPVGADYAIEPLLSAGDRVPRIGGGAYRMIGIPDGLGVRRLDDGGAELHMNHELPSSVESEPLVGGPANRGAFVSRFLLEGDGSVRAGDRAYETVFAENDRLGPAPDTTNETPAFDRFCSGSLAAGRVGFTEPIYLTGEESEGASSFDGRGGQAVAIYDDELHTLPKLGRFKKENSIVIPQTGRRTVIFPTEDGPASPNSQLWMYVGTKRKRGTELARNGLDNGRLYVFVVPNRSREGEFRKGTVRGRWVRIPNAGRLTDTQLEAAADRVGAFGFVRPEDGAASRTKRGEFFFVTTGGAAGNRLGRGYRLKIDPQDPTARARLSLIFNSDRIVAAGRDVAVFPDNIDVSRRYLMVQEDGTNAAANREGSIWRFDLRRRYARQRIAQLRPPARDGTVVRPGSWESSGIVHSGGALGEGSWLFDVQAHPPTTPPASNTVEDGQLLVMRPGG